MVGSISGLTSGVRSKRIIYVNRKFKAAKTASSNTYLKVKIRHPPSDELAVARNIGCMQSCILYPV